MFNYFKTTTLRQPIVPFKEYSKVAIYENQYHHHTETGINLVNNDNGEEDDGDDDDKFDVVFENESLEQLINDNYDFDECFEYNHKFVPRKPSLTGTTVIFSPELQLNDTIYKDTTVSVENNNKSISFYDMYYNCDVDDNNFSNEYVYLSIVKKLLESRERDGKGNALYDINNRWLQFDLKESRIVFISTTLPKTISDRQFTNIVLNRTHRILCHDKVNRLIGNCVKQIKTTNTNHVTVSTKSLIFTIRYENRGRIHVNDTIVEDHNDQIYGMMTRRQSVTNVHTLLPLDLLYGSIILQAIAYKLNTCAACLFYTIVDGKFSLSFETFDYYRKVLTNRPIRSDQCVKF